MKRNVNHKNKMVNNLFLQQERLHCNELDGWWVDVGNAERLSEAECLMQKS